MSKVNHPSECSIDSVRGGFTLPAVDEYCTMFHFNNCMTSVRNGCYFIRCIRVFCTVESIITAMRSFIVSGLSNSVFYQCMATKTKTTLRCLGLHFTNAPFVYIPMTTPL